MKKTAYSNPSIYTQLRIAIFIIMISIPLVAGIFGNTRTSTTENRRLSDKPRLTFKTIGSYAQDYQKYYSDTFPFRATLIAMQNYLNVGILKSSPRRDVIIGKNGWFFYDVEGPLQREKPFTADDLSTIRRNLTRVQESLEAQGIRFYLFVTPNTQTIYPEYLPDYLRPTSASRFDQLSRELSDNDPAIVLIDPRAALRESKIHYQPYRKYDTHWDDYGAFIAYEKLMTHIAADFPLVTPRGIDDFTISTKKIPNTDLLNMLAMNGYKTEYAPSMEPHHPRLANQTIISCRFKPNCETIQTTVDDPRLPRLLMYRDSFSNHLIPFIAEHFRNARYRWTHDVSMNDIQDQRPDIVVYQIVERDIPALKELRINQ